MKAVIHQAFCHIFDFNACASPLTQVHNAFVRDEAVFALEKNGKVRIEAFSDVISIENRQLACAFQTVGAHHPNVHPRNGQNARAAKGSRRDWTYRVAYASGLRSFYRRYVTVAVVYADFSADLGIAACENTRKRDARYL